MLSNGCMNQRGGFNRRRDLEPLMLGPIYRHVHMYGVRIVCMDGRVEASKMPTLLVPTLAVSMCMYVAAWRCFPCLPALS